MSSKRIRVVQKHPGALPKIIEIEPDLDAMCAAIGGGHLELVGLCAGPGVFCDEEGKLKNLAPNIVVPGGDVLVGTILCCGHDDEGDTIGLTQDHAQQDDAGEA